MGRHRRREMICEGQNCGRTFQGTGKTPLCPECGRLRRSAVQHKMYVAKTSGKSKPVKTDRAVEPPMSRKAVAAILDTPEDGFRPGQGVASLGDKYRPGSAA